MNTTSKGILQVNYLLRWNDFLYLFFRLVCENKQLQTEIDQLRRKTDHPIDELKNKLSKSENELKAKTNLTFHLQSKVSE